MLAIMESRHDSENAERILFNMRPRELVRKLFKVMSIMCNLKGTVDSIHVRGLSLIYQDMVAHRNLPLLIPQRAYGHKGLCDLGPYDFIGLSTLNTFLNQLVTLD